MKRKQTLDLIQQKENRLASLTEEADFTLSLVRNQITSLERINGQIDEELAQIDAYIGRLSATRNGLSAEAERNKKVAGNFAKLLCIE